MKPAMTLGLKTTGLFIFVMCNSKFVRRGVSILKLISG